MTLPGVREICHHCPQYHHQRVEMDEVDLVQLLLLFVYEGRHKTRVEYEFDRSFYQGTQ